MNGRYASTAVLIVGFLFAIGLAGCIRTNSLRMEASVRPAKSPSEPIEILEGSTLTRPYAVIGMVKARASRHRSSEDVLEVLRSRAREMGGDALVDLQWGESGGRVAIPTSGAIILTRRELYTAKVIVWKDTAH